MNIFTDFHRRFLIALLKHDVDFIVVGGLSVVYHGYIRTTGDMDLWIRPTNENKLKLLQVIPQFGLSAESGARPWPKSGMQEFRWATM